MASNVEIYTNNKNSRLKMIEWLVDNCKHNYDYDFLYEGSYHAEIMVVMFQDRGEAVHFKLTFAEGESN